MQETKQINLGDGQVVTLREMTVGDVRSLLKNVTSGSLSEVGIADLLGDKFDLLINHIKPFIDLPESMTFDDLTGSEVQTLWNEFCELNPFFQPIQKLVSMVTTMSPEQLVQLIKLQ